MPKDDLQIVFTARAGVGELIEKYLSGEIKDFSGTHDSLYARVRALGYNCNSLYEMVIAAEKNQKEK